MKKTKFLALVLVVAIMMMGAGYAYWNDTLVINNTMSTGKLEVLFTTNNYTRGGDDQTGTLDEGKHPYWNAYVNHEGLGAGHGGPTTTISQDRKTVTTNVTNMYPGAYAQYYGELENTGDIPAVFDNATVTFSGSNLLKSNLKFAFGYVIIDSNGNKVSPNTNSGDGRYYASGDVNDMPEKLNALFANVRLEPGQKLSLDFPTNEIAKEAMATIDLPWNEEMHCVTYRMSTLAGNDTELKTLGISITLNWKQHNK